MMKALAIAALATLLFKTTYAQIGGKKSTESIVIFDSIQVKPGDTLHFGSGTDRKGDFIYIYQPPNAWVGSAEYGLPRRYAGKYAVVKFFKMQKDKRTGEKTVAVLNLGGINLVADLEPAINAKEITSINSRSFLKSEAPTTVVVQQQQSVADELRKLKQLYEDSVLTKEEYEVQKKKLLDSH